MSDRKKRLKAPVAELPPDYSKLQADIENAMQIASGSQEIAEALGTGLASLIDLEAATAISSAQDALLSDLPSPDVLRGAFRPPDIPRLPEIPPSLPPEIYEWARRRPGRSSAPQKSGGRPPNMIDAEKLRKARGDTPLVTFARLCRLCPDTIERAEISGQTSKKSARKIERYLQRKDPKIQFGYLKKNPP